MMDVGDIRCASRDISEQLMLLLREKQIPAIGIDVVRSAVHGYLVARTGRIGFLREAAALDLETLKEVVRRAG